MQLPDTRNDWRSVTALASVINGDRRPQTLSVHAIRHYVRLADENGLAPHVRRLGRKILVSEAGFFQWLSSLPANREVA